MTSQGFHIVVGDANGADKAFQKYLADMKYASVEVFCAGEDYRNNIGDWKVNRISVDPALKGRDFYAQKDKAMAAIADYGLVLWDGKSSGSINNVLELINRQKTIVVYFAPEKKFYTVRQREDVIDLLKHCDKKDYQGFIKWLRIDDKGENETRAPAQASFTL